MDSVIWGTLIAGIVTLIAAGIWWRRGGKVSTADEAVPLARDKRNHALIGFRKLLFSDPGYVDIWRRGRSGQPLNDETHTVYYQLLFEYWHAQQEGYLRAVEVDDQWSLERARETVIADYERLPEALDRLEVGRMLHPEYEKFLNDMLKEIGVASETPKRH